MNTVKTGRVVVCRGCNGDSVSLSDVGGINLSGCSACNGTGLIIHE